MIPLAILLFHIQAAALSGNLPDSLVSRKDCEHRTTIEGRSRIAHSSIDNAPAQAVRIALNHVPANATWTAVRGGVTQEAACLLVLHPDVVAVKVPDGSGLIEYRTRGGLPGWRAMIVTESDRH